MDDDEPDEKQQPTEKLPKTGLEVPIPTRKDVMDAIRKVSKPDEEEPPRPAEPQESARPE
jgi:hypothetical protein